MKDAHCLEVSLSNLDDSQRHLKVCSDVYQIVYPSLQMLSVHLHQITRTRNRTILKLGEE